jgi:hypothetical protein
MSTWRPLRRLLTRSEMEIEATLLESAGIPTYLPDRHWYGIYPSQEFGSAHAYRLYVLETDLQDARLLLGERVLDTAPNYPCPACGGETRRLRRIWAIIALCILRETIAPFPFYRRKRICLNCKTRHLPERAAPFSQTEIAHL